MEGTETTIRTWMAEARSFGLRVGVLTSALVLVAASTLTAPMHGDESITLWYAGSSWRELWRSQAIHDRVFFPYYSMLHVWDGGSLSAVWARLPSLICFGAFVVATAWTARRFVGVRWALGAAALASLCPVTLYFSTYIRSYAAAQLFAVLTVGAALRLRERPSRRAALATAAFGLVAVAMHLFVAMPALLVVGAVFLERRVALFRKGLGAWLPIVFLAVASTVWARLVANQASVQLSFVDVRSQRLMAVAALVVIVLATIALGHFLRLPEDPGLRRLLLVWACLWPLLLASVTVVLPWFTVRYLMGSVPAWAIALAVIAERQTAAARTFVAMAAAMAVAMALATVAVFAIAYSHRSAVDTARYLDAQLRPGDGLALATGQIDFETRYYMSQDQKTTPWPRWTSNPYWGTWVLRTDPASVAAAPSRVWIVLGSGSSQKSDQLLANMRVGGFTVVSTTDFSGRTVVLLTREPRLMPDVGRRLKLHTSSVDA